MKSEDKTEQLCTIQSIGHNAFVVGDKIAWAAIVNGKITRLEGGVSDIVGETMLCIGKCVATGNWWRDYVSIYDKSVSRLATPMCMARRFSEGKMP